MQNINLTLKAGVAQRVPVSGNVLVVLSADQGNGLTIDFAAGNAVGATLNNMGPGARIAPAGGFTGVTVTAPEDGDVKMIVTAGDIDVQILQQSATIANGDASAIPVRLPAGARLPVDIGGGTVEVTASNVAINNDPANPVPVSLVSQPGAPLTVTPTQGTTIAEQAPAAVAAFVAGAPNQVELLTAGARHAVRVLNAGVGYLYIGGPGVTPTNAVIVLAQGDIWSETDVPGAALYATSDTGTTANVQVVA